MISFYNLKHIVKIEVLDKILIKEYYPSYKTGSKFKQYFQRPEGIYWGGVKMFELDEKNIIIEDECVYARPKIVFTFNDKSTKVLYYDTYLLALAGLNKLRSENTFPTLSKL